MSGGEDKALFDPDPNFASQWFVEDPVAQGALKHASIVVLDEINEARDEANEPEPDLGDLSPLGLFPAPIRPALTPWLIERIHSAALLMGWKLAQPKTAIPPACIAEELALELIRLEAASALELIGAPMTSIDATKGVYRVCVHENLADFFAAYAPAEAALGASYSIQAAEDSNSRLAKWFMPFFQDQVGGAVHPYFHEEPWGLLKRTKSSRLKVVKPDSPPEVALGKEETFRVCIRIWHDDFLEDKEMFRMPGMCRFRVQAANAEAAREAAIKLFPEGAVERNVFSDDGLRLDDEDVARLSIEIQRVGLAQDYKAHASYHLIGTLGDDLPSAELSRLTGYLSETFPAAVVATEDDSVFFAVTINAESYEEADADLHECVEAFMDAIGAEGEPIDGYTTSVGGLNAEDLWQEIYAYQQRWLRS